MRGILAGLVTGLALAACPTGASAAGDMQTGIADDRLILANDSSVAAIARRWALMGIDSVRIHARWIAVVPRPVDRRKPASFDMSDPEDPDYNWAALDRAVRALRANGIEPILAVTGSGPVWASRRPALDNPRYRPEPRLFGRFAGAVARRYGGQVDRYLIWNEPNLPAWLQPQHTCRRGRCLPESPHLYRELFRFAASAIRREDATAEVLFGTLAPRGSAPTSRNARVRPLAFLRAMSCVTRRYRRDHRGRCRRAKAVRADGFAYHPHPVRMTPEEHAPARDDAAIADLGRLATVLDRSTRTGIVKPVGDRRFAIHLTEFGYQTNPPDKNVGISVARQARWVQQATYIAWKDPRIKTITQYEFEDEPLAMNTAGTDQFAAWQSGLVFVDRTPKPLLAAFPNPFWVDRRRGRATRFWGQVRPGGAHRVELQYRADGVWTTLRVVDTNAFGYWTAKVGTPAPGKYRFSYVMPADDGPGTVTRFSTTQDVGPEA